MPDSFVRVDSPFAEPPADQLEQYAGLYPEVAAAGSLRDALQEVADRAGLGLTVDLRGDDGWRYIGARAEAGGRSVSVLMASSERCFVVDCWAQGEQMAKGTTEDLAEVAGAMSAWLQAPRVRELVSQWPFLRTWDLAEAHERGEGIAQRWVSIRKPNTRRPDPELEALVEAAYRQPRLRALSPGKSMWWLTFSRRAVPPISHDLPRTRPLGHGRYEVTYADRRVVEVDGAEAAVAAILDGLPDDAVPEPWTP